jgi:hypothetical protein
MIPAEKPGNQCHLIMVENFCEEVKLYVAEYKAFIESKNSNGSDDDTLTLGNRPTNWPAVKSDAASFCQELESSVHSYMSFNMDVEKPYNPKLRCQLIAAIEEIDQQRRDIQDSSLSQSDKQIKRRQLDEANKLSRIPNIKLCKAAIEKYRQAESAFANKAVALKTNRYTWDQIKFINEEFFRDVLGLEGKHPSHVTVKFDLKALASTMAFIEEASKIVPEREINNITIPHYTPDPELQCNLVKFYGVIELIDLQLDPKGFLHEGGSEWKFIREKALDVIEKARKDDLVGRRSYINELIIRCEIDLQRDFTYFRQLRDERLPHYQRAIDEYNAVEDQIKTQFPGIDDVLVPGTDQSWREFQEWNRRVHQHTSESISNGRINQEEFHHSLVNVDSRIKVVLAFQEQLSQMPSLSSLPTVTSESVNLQEDIPKKVLKPIEVTSSLPKIVGVKRFTPKDVTIPISRITIN